MVDGLIVDSLAAMAVCQTELRHHRRAAVRNRDPAPHAGRAERLAPVHDVQQRVTRRLVESQECHELGQDLVRARALEIQ